MKHKNIFITIITILAALTALVMLKLFTPEDTWLCDDGQWVRHGNPSAEMPADDCR